jgi:hypothetical protein
LTLAGAGFVYGAIGVFTLGVTLDYGLLAGAVVLGTVAGAPGMWRLDRGRLMDRKMSRTRIAT